MKLKAKIYTKTGDAGTTALVGGTRVKKDDARLAAYGTLDELNSSLGLLRHHTVQLEGQFRDEVQTRLQSIQNSLFNIGSQLACESDTLRAQLPQMPPDRIHALESDMDVWEHELPPLKNFILPGGSQAACLAHVARTICRRAERECVHLSHTDTVDPEHLRYINRLSDWLFLLARKLNNKLGVSDVIWDQN